ncbi:N,N-dimethylformamidase beta subunit family domain-containing protein, partial [Sinorhizobium sojae]|uniref:N,N-dimethylformamidase beta subunit family domain-containing protein n=1 Tax=Sinorhizobium sojae TaxID=716925 RepID=UPI001FCC4A00
MYDFAAISQRIISCLVMVAVGDLRSILLEPASLSWLRIGRRTRSHGGALRREEGPRAPATGQRTYRDEQDARAIPTTGNDPRRRRQHLVSDARRQVDADDAPSPAAVSRACGAVVQGADLLRTAFSLSSIDRSVRGPVIYSRDLALPQSPAPAGYEGSESAGAIEPKNSRPVVIHRANPSVRPVLDVAEASVLDQSSDNVLQADGQFPGTRMSDGNYVSNGQGTFGSSANDPLFSPNLVPLTGWTDSGETSTWTMTGQFGIQPGLVTSAAAPTTSQSLAAAAATNPIVLENQKPGNPESEWGINGSGDSNIEGFATDISVNRGQTVSFKINTNSSNYRIDIYRLGYYGGMGARKVATIQHTGVQNQPTPLRDSTTGLVDAGNWSISASWAIPADAASGIYFAKLVRQDGVAGQNHIPFIVRDDSSQSDIIFQTSDETWQAYNPWGGANLYQGNGPATDSSPGRAYAVSYNRPITTRGGGLSAGPQDYIFGVEYPAIRWLEMNGYDVSYMAGMDSDRLGSLIQNHKMFLSVGHDEYWSGQQRANVEAARDAGVNLCFWSGNEVYWATRFAPSISAGAQPYRTLVCYKETRAGPIDPDNQWTGTYRDPRFVSPTAVGGGRPENALTGTMFQVDSYRSDAITIPYDDANLRFWRNTSVANLQPGQTATLERNYLGYEWDASPDNGFRPAGLIELSSTTLPVNQYLLDYGTVTGPATATHNLTLYRAPSGALVFSAGTVYWAWGLDANHDLEATPVDPRVKQAMVNLLADMGIQPGTLEAGLVSASQSTDATKPVSSITAPNDGTALKVGAAVTISGTASDVGGVIAAVEVSTDGGATWHRAVGDENWTYSWVTPRAGTFTIKTRAVDDSVNLETPGAGRTVTVTGNNFFPASVTPPIVPDVDAKPIEVGMKFQSSVAGTVTGVRYYKSDLNIGPHTGSLWSSTGTKLATVTFTNESGVGWQAASFSNPIAITAGTTYVVSYHTNYGHYTATGNYFTSPVTNGPLTAPTNAGVYTYSSASAFPSSTFNGENYWVDVLFNPASTSNTAPMAIADTA